MLEDAETEPLPKVPKVDSELALDLAGSDDMVVATVLLCAISFVCGSPIGREVMM